MVSVNVRINLFSLFSRCDHSIFKSFQDENSLKALLNRDIPRCCIGIFFLFLT